MAHEHCIEVLAGEAAWLKNARVILFVLAQLSLLLSNTFWYIKLPTAALFLLLSLGFFKRAQQHAHLLSLRFDTSGFVTLVEDSGAEIHAVLDGRAWVSAWFCVVTICPLDDHPKQNLLVFRSTNPIDSYRQMLIYLRYGADSSTTDGILLRQ